MLPIRLLSVFGWLWLIAFASPSLAKMEESPPPRVELNGLTELEETFSILSSEDFDVYDVKTGKRRPPRYRPPHRRPPGYRPPPYRPHPPRRPPPRPRPPRVNYEWVFDYAYHYGPCYECHFSCFNAPRCDGRFLGYKMACPIPGTRNALEVYTCARVVWNRPPW